MGRPPHPTPRHEEPSLIRDRLEDVATRVPAGRDRAADLLRLAAITFVVVGHWVVAVVLERDGQLVEGQLLAMVPETRPLTWIFQVMPLFFFIGGYVNVGSWCRAAEEGATWTDWVRRRSGRLLRPLAPLVGLWIVAVFVAEAAGVPVEWIETASETALLPVWFLVVYLVGIGLAPATLVLHRRFGLWVVLIAIVATAAIDQLHLAGVPAIGFLNYALVWAGVHQLGYLWYDRVIPWSPRRHLAVGASTVLPLALLLALDLYPLSMVAVWGAERQNTDPPTLALWLFALTQINLVLAAKGWLERRMQRDREYGIVVVGGSIMLTVFLWHMTAFVLVAAAVPFVPGWPLTARIDGTWWALRPLWLVACALVLALLVAVFGRFERSSPPVTEGQHLRTVVGLVAAVAGLAVVMADGLYDPDRAFGVEPLAIVALFAGMASLGVLSRR